MGQGQSVSGVGALAALLLGTVVPMPCVAQWEGTSDIGLRVRSSEQRVVDGQLGKPIDATVLADGTVCVLDLGAFKVACIDEAGTVRVAFGRKGGGPGEFMLPYRISSNRAGEILVLDISPERVLRFSAAGNLLSEVSIQMRFAQVGGLVALDRGEFAVGGYAPVGGVAADFAVHVFDSLGGHIKSFGALPKLKRPDILYYLGPGWLTGGRHNDLVYTRIQPHEVYVFSARGDLRRMYRLKHAVSAEPEEGYAIERSSTQSRLGRAGIEVTDPMPTIELADGQLLAGYGQIGREGMKALSWQLLRVGGQVSKAVPLDPAVLPVTPFGEGPRGVLWMLSQDNGIPVLRSVVLDRRGS